MIKINLKPILIKQVALLWWMSCIRNHQIHKEPWNWCAFGWLLAWLSACEFSIFFIILNFGWSKNYCIIYLYKYTSHIHCFRCVHKILRPIGSSDLKHLLLASCLFKPVQKLSIYEWHCEYHLSSFDSVLKSVVTFMSNTDTFSSKYFIIKIYTCPKCFNTKKL